MALTQSEGWGKNSAYTLISAAGAGAGMALTNERDDNLMVMWLLLAAVAFTQLLGVGLNYSWSKREEGQWCSPAIKYNHNIKTALIIAFIAAMGLATGAVARATGEHDVGLSRLNPIDNNDTGYRAVLALTAACILLHAARPVVPAPYIPLPGCLSTHLGYNQIGL